MNARWRTLMVLLAVVSVSSGCVAVALLGGAAAGGAAYAYISGEASHTYKAVIGQVHDAAKAAIAKDFQYAINQDMPTEIIATAPGDRTLTLTLEYVSDEATEVKLRIGTFGDEELSYKILNKIRDRLSAPARSGYPDPH